MKKIKDRITLGIVAGVLANVVKQGLSYVFKKLKLINITAPDKAAAMFISKRKTKKPAGSIVGIVADFCIACKLGILLVYVLSATGKDNHLLKGWSIGSLAWTLMYGFLSRMGGTGFSQMKPRDSLSGYFTHAIFGLAVAELIVRLGDEKLFKPRYQTLSSPDEEFYNWYREKNAANQQGEELLTY
ncbi:MAG: hypothetical protein JM58_13555 [Peptococcaceae bacterium BICA1-8]|nr:MAG: hypothetical protein JM58_13555 [Peptococcaceae bacterium BICA1-8]